MYKVLFNIFLSNAQTNYYILHLYLNTNHENNHILRINLYVRHAKARIYSGHATK